MTTREYAFWTMAFLEAAMVVSLKKTGMAKEIPKDANLANAKFVEDHMAENGGDTERVRATQEEGPLSWPAT